EEEAQEEGFENPGKLIRLNVGDADRDFVPDFADGLNRFNNGGGGASRKFVPLVFDLKGIDPQKGYIRFDYNASNPAEIGRFADPSVPGGFTYTLPRDRWLRIWTKDGDSSRRAEPAGAGTNAGDFISPQQPV